MVDITKIVPKADMVNVDTDVSPITYTPGQTAYTYNPAATAGPAKEDTDRIQYMPYPDSQYATQPVEPQQTLPVYNPIIVNNPTVANTANTANTTDTPTTPSTTDTLKTIRKYIDIASDAVNSNPKANAEPVPGTPEYYENKINTTIANNPVLNTVDNAATGIGMFQLGDLLTKKGLSKTVSYIGSKVGLGMAARIGLKFVPGLGWVSLAYDVGKFVAPYILSKMEENSARDLKEVKEKYPTLDDKSAEALARVQSMSKRNSVFSR